MLSLYQGRVYADSLAEALNPDGLIKTGVLKEFISTAVEKCFVDPDEVRKRNRMIYDLLDEVLRDEQ